MEFDISSFEKNFYKAINMDNPLDADNIAYFDLTESQRKILSSYQILAKMYSILEFELQKAKELVYKMTAEKYEEESEIKKDALD